MKFLDQVNAYQRALSKKSRFFSSLMLVSGISLVAAAPFLSYEVSKLECQEKGSVPPKVSDDEMIILKNDWERKDRKIVDLEDAILNKDEKIKDLIEDANCDDVIRVIQTEKNELEEDKTNLGKDIVEVEKERDDCRKQLNKCQKEKEVIIKEGSDFDKLESERKKLIIERDRWKNQYEKCEEEKEVIINGKSDCSEVEKERKKLIVERDRWIAQYEKCKKNLAEQSNSTDCSKVNKELEICNQKLAENKEEITGLRRSLRACEATSKISISGSFHYNETFTINNDEFVLSGSLADDPKLGYNLVHNGRDVTQKLKTNNKGASYSYTSRKKRYRIDFGREGKNSVMFQLLSL